MSQRVRLHERKTHVCQGNAQRKEGKLKSWKKGSGTLSVRRGEAEGETKDWKDAQTVKQHEGKEKQAKVQQLLCFIAVFP